MVPEEWRGVDRIPTPSGDQEMAVLTEPGLFFFLNRSDKAAALPFQKWIAGEVLPSIRKTGSYVAPTAGLSNLEMLQATVNAMVEHEKRLNQTHAQVQTLADKVEAIEDRAQAAQESLDEVPGPDVNVPTISTRAMTNRVVRDFCIATASDFQAAWRRLYMEFRDRYHIDLPARATHSKSKPMDIVESMGMEREVYALAIYLFRQEF